MRKCDYQTNFFPLVYAEFDKIKNCFSMISKVTIRVQIKSCIHNGYSGLVASIFSESFPQLAATYLQDRLQRIIVYTGP